MSPVASLAADEWLSGQLGVPAFHARSANPDGVPAGPSFVDARVPTHDVSALRSFEDAGFRVVDTAVTLRRRDRAIGGPAGHVGHADPGDADAVDRIAATALTRSRFHLDPRIPDSVASSLKSAWVRNFFAGARGDWLVVARDGGAVTGFLLLLDRDDLVIDLVAVDPDHQGRGIGRAMLAFAAVSCGSAPGLLVGTQAANVESLGFYGALGFRVVGTEYVLHRHGS